MTKSTGYTWIKASNAYTVNIKINPDLSQYKDRIVTYQNSPAERGHPRTICAINADLIIQWVVDRLTMAEKHEPWPGVMPYRDKY